MGIMNAIKSVLKLLLVGKALKSKMNANLENEIDN